MTPGNEAPAASGIDLFEIRFASAMTDVDLARLTRELDLPSRIVAADTPRAQQVGPARLDDASGLFLTAGESEGQWSLRARSWGEPGPAAIHRWAIMAADAAHGLDPSVPRPDRRPDDRPAVRDRRVYREAGSPRFGGLRRRLVGRRP